MTLIAGQALDPKKFFSSGEGVVHGSSIDLTIGEIIDGEGKMASDPFILKPGEIVQVVSAEVFKLPGYVTGHVTYKTTLTHQGIWALTVGIVDPGWTGPLTTTLLNFSKVCYPIHRGDEFLRVSFFEHAPVHRDHMRRAPPLREYVKKQQKAAASLFPKTFLDRESIAAMASHSVMNSLRTEGLAWVALIAIVLAVAQYVADFGSYSFPPGQSGGEVRAEMENLRRELATLKERVDAPGSAYVTGNSPEKPSTEIQETPVKDR
jgi:dUTPase